MSMTGFDPPGALTAVGQAGIQDPCPIEGQSPRRLEQSSSLTVVRCGIREGAVADVVEVFWDAQPALRRLGLKGTGTGALDPRAEALFREVRSAASSVFVGAVTLVRIEVRRESRAD